MIKASNTILFKSADEPYLDAEWVGSYSEATTGRSTGVPNFIGTPGYVIPKPSSSEDLLTDSLCDFFKVTTNISYKIMSTMDGIRFDYYNYPIPYKLQRTSFVHSDTLIFVDEQFKDLSKVPDRVLTYKWDGRPGSSDIPIKISPNGRINLGQKGIGGLLVVYEVLSDVYQVLTHEPVWPLGWFPFEKPMVFGIFATDGSSLTASLRLDPAK